MAEFSTNEHDAALLVEALSESNRKLVSFEGDKLVGPTPVINQITAMDISALRKSFLLSYAGMRRWIVETGGIELNGMQVRTDRESQALINGAYNMAMQNEQFVTKFKASSGWVTLDAPTIIAVATAVGAHVAACFALEEGATAQIESGNMTTRQQVDEAISL